MFCQNIFEFIVTSFKVKIKKKCFLTGFDSGSRHGHDVRLDSLIM